MNNDMKSFSVCPHPKCDARIPKNQYACKPHWLDLPEKLRNDIWKGFRENAKLWSKTDKEIRALWAKEQNDPTP